MVIEIGEPLSSPAKSRKGRTACRIKRILDTDSALTLMFRLTRSFGDSLALNSKDLLPIEHPVTSAWVASARKLMQATC